MPRVFLPLFLSAAVVGSPPVAVPLAVRVVVHGALSRLADGGSGGEVTLEPLLSGGSGLPLRASISKSREARFDLPPDSGWRVTVSLPDAWSRPAVVRIAGGEPPLPVVVDAYPAAKLSGALRVPVGTPMPAELQVRLRSAPGAADPLGPVALSCPVSGGRFACTLPAGRLDVRLRAERLSTAYLWGVDLSAGGRKDVGTLELKPGASVVGWIESPRRDLALDSGTAELEPRRSGVPPAADDPVRHAALHLRAQVSSRGFFELAGVSPGLYVLTVRYPGFAPARISPVEVQPLAETELDPIRLQLPVELEVRVEPPRDPYGNRWALELLREDLDGSHFERSAAGMAGEDGTWNATGLEPGSYLLQTKGGFQSEWASIPVAVRPGMAPVEVSLPFVEVLGSVRLGEDPLECVLWFGGLHGAQRIPARSDRGGRFRVVLPDRPSWRIELLNGPLHLRASLPDVPIRKEPGSGRARLSLAVPDTVVRGTVVDESGEAVPGSRVKISRPDDHPDDAVADSSGRFEVRGLSAGIWQLEARAKGASSESVAADVRERVAGADLRLVLRRKLELTGEVVDPGGNPVFGAQVVAMFSGLGTLTTALPRASTDVSGVFKLTLPAGVDGVQLTVFPPGFAVRQLYADPHDDAPLVIPVSSEGGTLILRYEDGGPDRRLPAFETSIVHDFVLASPYLLESWAELNGVAGPDARQFVIPQLEPGRYTACRTAQVGALLAGNPAPPGIPCVSGDLPAGGELRLDLSGPSSKDQP
jgi:hypothetical protein